MKIPAIFALIAGLVPLAASADETFRCGKWIVTSAMTLSEITARCGAPSAHESKKQDVRVQNSNGFTHKIGESVTDTWTYDRGAHTPAMVVTVVDGRIKSIDRKN
jgi:hypothetical protein